MYNHTVAASTEHWLSSWFITFSSRCHSSTLSYQPYLFFHWVAVFALSQTEMSMPTSDDWYNRDRRPAEVLFRKNKNIRNTVQLWIRLLHWKAFKGRQQTGGTININHGAMICLCTVSAVHVLFSASRVRQRVTAGPRCFKPCCEKCHMHICLRMNNEKTCNYITEASWDTPFTCV